MAKRKRKRTLRETAGLGEKPILRGNVTWLTANQRRYGANVAPRAGEELLPAWTTDWIALPDGSPTGLRNQLIGVAQANGHVRYIIQNEYAQGQHVPIVCQSLLDSRWAWEMLVAKWKAYWTGLGISYELAAMVPAEDDRTALVEGFYGGVKRKGQRAVDQLQDYQDFHTGRRGRKVHVQMTTEERKDNDGRSATAATA